MKPMSAEQCVAEALRALGANRATVVPGRINRLVSALVPSSVKRNMMGNMIAKARAGKRS